MSTFKDSLTVKLSEERVGRKLPPAVVGSLVKYLVEDCSATSLDEVDLSAVGTLAKEAWKAEKSTEIPPKVLRDVEYWRDRVPAKTTGDAFIMVDASESLAEDTSELFGDHGGNPKELEKFHAAKTAQGIAGVRILTLSLSLITGRMHGSGDVVGIVFWGCEPRVCETAKKLRKAGVKFLHEKLEFSKAHVRYALTEHFTDLIRGFSDDGKLQESVTRARDRSRAFGCMAGPPCKFYSTIRIRMMT